MNRLSGLFTGWSGRKAPVVQAKASDAPLGAKAATGKLLGDDLATMGVSLAVLRDLPVEPDADFRAVCEEIKRMTAGAEGNRSLASHLRQNPETSHLVGKAEYFVSYAWSGGFGATMNALSKHFENKPAPFVWMDVAMVDQHAAATTDVDFDVWSKTFGESLRSIGKALLVLSPGEKPIAVSRSWCCFEWVCIKQSGIPFEYCVNPKDIDGLLARMKSGMGIGDYKNMFAGINIEKARAFKASDEAAILLLMRQIGVKQVNDIVQLSLKDWLLSVAHQGEKQLAAKHDKRNAVNILNSKAALHQALGELDEALLLYEAALKETRNLSNFDREVAEQLNNLALILHSKGDLAKAEPLYREAIELGEKALGKEHAELAMFMNNFGGLLQGKGDYAEAESLFRRAIEIGEKTLGRDHFHVARWLNNLAALLRAKGDYDSAEPLLREALVIDRKALGDSHPDVATDLNNLAAVLRLKGDINGAEPLLREALEIDKRALGDEHLDVATDLNDLASLLRVKGEFDAAETLYGEALAIRRRALGPEHAKVGQSLNNLAALFRAKKDFASAEPLYREAIAIGEKALGKGHPELATWIINLASLLMALQKDEEAKTLFEEGLAIHRKVLGNDHKELGPTIFWLATLAKRNNDKDSALSLSKEALRIYELNLGPNHGDTKFVRTFVESVDANT